MRSLLQFKNPKIAHPQVSQIVFSIVIYSYRNVILTTAIREQDYTDCCPNSFTHHFNAKYRVEIFFGDGAIFLKSPLITEVGVGGLNRAIS
jgi:hypothetical protein